MEVIGANVFLTSNIMLLLMILALRMEVKQLRSLVRRFEAAQNSSAAAGPNE